MPTIPTVWIEQLGEFKDVEAPAKIRIKPPLVPYGVPLIIFKRESSPSTWAYFGIKTTAPDGQRRAYFTIGQFDQMPFQEALDIATKCRLEAGPLPIAPKAKPEKKEQPKPAPKPKAPEPKAEPPAGQLPPYPRPNPEPEGKPEPAPQPIPKPEPEPQPSPAPEPAPDPQTTESRYAVRMPNGWRTDAEIAAAIEGKDLARFLLDAILEAITRAKEKQAAKAVQTLLDSGLTVDRITELFNRIQNSKGAANGTE